MRSFLLSSLFHHFDYGHFDLLACHHTDIIEHKGSLQLRRDDRMKSTFMWGATFRGERPDAEPLDFEEMSIPCTHCGALFWKAETLIGKGRTRHQHQTPQICCGKDGEVHNQYKEAAFREPQDQQVLTLFTGKHPKSEKFLSNICLYNTIFSMITPLVRRIFRTVRNKKVVFFNGRLSYVASNLPDERAVGEMSTTQMYFEEDVTTAAMQRMHFGQLACDDATSLLDPEIVELFERYFRTYNPYAQIMRSARDIWREEEAAARARNEPFEEVRIIFNPKRRDTYRGVDRPVVESYRKHFPHAYQSEDNALTAVVAGCTANPGYDLVITPRPEFRSEDYNKPVGRDQPIVDILAYPMHCGLSCNRYRRRHHHFYYHRWCWC